MDDVVSVTVLTALGSDQWDFRLSMDAVGSGMLVFLKKVGFGIGEDLFDGNHITMIKLACQSREKKEGKPNQT